MKSQFKFSVGPWNIQEGTDTFGPEVRKTIAFAKKVEKFKEIGTHIFYLSLMRPPVAINSPSYLNGKAIVVIKAISAWEVSILLYWAIISTSLITIIA